MTVPDIIKTSLIAAGASILVAVIGVIPKVSEALASAKSAKTIATGAQTEAENANKTAQSAAVKFEGIQTGYSDCSYTRPLPGQWTEFFRKTIDFSVSYKNPPKIFISLNAWEAYGSNGANPVYRFTVVESNTKDFTVVGYAAYTVSITACDINWLAVGESE